MLNLYYKVMIHFLLYDEAFGLFTVYGWVYGSVMELMLFFGIRVMKEFVYVHIIKYYLYNYQLNIEHVEYTIINLSTISLCIITVIVLYNTQIHTYNYVIMVIRFVCYRGTQQGCYINTPLLVIMQCHHGLL